MFSTKSSNSPTLSSRQNQLSLLEQHLKKVDALLQNPLTIGNHQYRLSEWLGNKGHQEKISPNQLHAGFQAAALARHVDDQLFFLEHLNQVSDFIKDYLSIEKMAETDKSQKNQVKSNETLLKAFNQLSLLWQNCFIDESYFKLNFSHSDILSDTSIRQGEQGTAGQQKIKALHLKISKCHNLLNSIRQAKASKLLGLPNFTPKELNQEKITEIREVMIDAYAVFNKVLIGVASSIKQVNERCDVAERVMKKWPKTQSPALWSKAKETQQAEIKSVAQLILDEHENGLQAECTSQSPLSPRFLSPRQKNKAALPEHVLLLAESLTNADMPFKDEEIDRFATLKEAISKLKDKHWGGLKEKIQCGQQAESLSLFTIK